MNTTDRYQATGLDLYQGICYCIDFCIRLHRTTEQGKSALTNPIIHGQDEIGIKNMQKIT